MHWLILLLAIAFPVGYGYREGVTDAKKIARNGSRDDLKERFHFNNALVRFIVLVLASGVVMFALKSVGIGLAYLLYAIAAFGWFFTTTLNRKRGLPTWYVSRDLRASKTDKFFIATANNWNTLLGKLNRKYGFKLHNLITTPQTFSRLLHSVFLLLGILILAAVILYKFTNNG